jgi:DNA-binding MarR family transcriptional regulator
MAHIPDIIFEREEWKKLKGTETKVFILLCKYYNRKERRAYPSIGKIADLVGASKRSVYMAIDGLCKYGLIIKRKKPNPYGKDFNYYLLPDMLFQEMEGKNLTPSAKNALASEIIALLGAKASNNLVQKLHPINNYINQTIIKDSFNSKQKTQNKTESPKNRLGSLEGMEEIIKRSSALYEEKQRRSSALEKTKR